MAQLAFRREGSFDSRHWRALFAAFCAVTLGTGLCRFSYSALMPAVISEAWFTPSDAAYLGAANLAGYLAAALFSRALARYTSATAVIRGMLVLSTLSFLACAWPLPLLWFFPWRFISGFAAGTFVVIAAPAVLSTVDPSRRGAASGLIFAGIGVGIVASGTLVPLLVETGLSEAWVALSAGALILTWFAWRWLPSGEPQAGVVSARPTAGSGAIRSLHLQYGLNAAGLAAPMVFLVDYVVRGVGLPLSAGGLYWVVFGLGALVGPVLTGCAGDRFGFSSSIRIGLVIQAMALAGLAVSGATVVLVAASFILGGFVPGVVPLVMGRIRELAPGKPDLQHRAWSIGTAAFGTGQAGAAYAYSWLLGIFDHPYPVLFALGAAAIAIALLISFLPSSLLGGD